MQKKRLIVRTQEDGHCAMGGDCCKGDNCAMKHKQATDQPADSSKVDFVGGEDKCCHERG